MYEHTQTHQVDSYEYIHEKKNLTLKESHSYENNAPSKITFIVKAKNRGNPRHY